MRALLDVNVLIALLDAAHVHHSLTARWIDGAIDHGWASCPITQLGCIRVMSQPAYPNSQPVAQVAARLAEATRNQHHEFWGDSLDALQAPALHWPAVLTSRHVTDVYLLALAVARDARFVTFDRHVPLAAVTGVAEKNLLVLQ
jgi:uncharacterized protein